jgi:DNA-binding PucR family transcriptional regulator
MPTTWQSVLDAALARTGVDGLAATAVDALAREWDVLRDDPDLRDLARRSAAANLALVAEVARGDLDLATAEPPPQAIAYARELARRNVPMAELARSYRIAQHVMWRFGVDELHGDADAIEQYTDATFATGDVLMGNALERYAQERDRWVRSADALRRETVLKLLSGEPTDVAAASARLRYELRRAHVAFVVWAETEDAGLETTAIAVGGAGALVVPLGAGTMAGWCAPGALDHDIATEARVAFGLPGEGTEGFRRSHLQAMEARRIMRLSGLRGPVDYDEVALAALLTADLDQARAFAVSELGALAAPDVARLADTALEVLAQQGSPRRAAQRLGLHENTVAKRVRAAEEALGRPITERPAQTLAALMILRVVRGPASSR